ncbi:MAG TPA: SDR family NAD(P)-dependent oxidoreductase [Solirubrobacteraceae bacterium]|nr:SDR family NAD(P)-dependent oxidoreductase [Solirubrobacteraceae bacterium]
MGRTVLITGAAGGLGGAVVAAFGEHGWRVVAPVRRAGAEVAGAETVVADLADPAAAAAAFDVAAGDAQAPLRAVVTAAGGFAGGTVAGTPVEEFEAQFRLNLRTAYVTIQAALPHLAAAGGGAIVCVGSRAGTHPFGGAAGYVASKAALHALADVVAREHRDDGIRCNVVVPGTIDTPANREAGMKGGVPPAAIARVIRFLCSEDAAATSGAIVPVYPP